MTIARAVGMQRMADRGAVIRRLSAVEMLGSSTVICSDKTGNLTRHEMTAVALWLPGGREIAVSGIGHVPEGGLVEGGRPAEVADSAVRDLCLAATLCHDAQLLPLEIERAGWSVLGDPTEGALLVLARKAGLALEALRRESPREAELPFDSDNKLMATRHRMAGAPRRVWIKGAPARPGRPDRSARRGGQALGRRVPGHRHPPDHGHGRPQAHRPGHRARTRHRARWRSRRGRPRARTHGRRRQRCARAGARRGGRGDGHHRHRGGQERGQDRHHRRQLRHHRRRRAAGPRGLRQLEEGDPAPLRHLVDGVAGAGAGARPTCVPRWCAGWWWAVACSR